MSVIRMAMIGCGGNSGGHARRLKEKPEVQIVAGCDVSDEIVATYIENHLADVEPKPAAYTDFQKMLDETKPDAVLISTPHTLHFEQAMAALDAGCHVLLEKPMVTSSPDAYVLADKVKETGKILAIGYNTACSPVFYYLREQIRKETFGKLELVTGYITQNWMAATAGKWRQEPSLSGGGQAYDSGAHLLNSLCWSVESNIAEVHAFTDNHGTKVDINSSINVRFENGVMAAIAISGNCPATPGGRHMAFVFENGRVEIDGWGGSFIHIFGPDGEIEAVLTEKAQTPDDNFVDAVLGRAEPRTSAVNGIVQCELMDAIYESARTGQTVRPKRT